MRSYERKVNIYLLFQDDMQQIDRCMHLNVGFYHSCNPYNLKIVGTQVDELKGKCPVFSRMIACCC